MHELPRTIPDVRMLLALPPEELAATILLLLKKRNEAKFHTGNLQRELWAHSTAGQPQYPRQHENEINLALSEAWAWLQVQGLIVLDTENRQYGWLVLSRRARAMVQAGLPPKLTASSFSALSCCSTVKPPTRQRIWYLPSDVERTAFGGEPRPTLGAKRVGSLHLYLNPDKDGVLQRCILWCVYGCPSEADWRLRTRSRP